jgi:hypothetical protein
VTRAIIATLLTILAAVWLFGKITGLSDVPEEGRQDPCDSSPACMAERGNAHTRCKLAVAYAAEQLGEHRWHDGAERPAFRSIVIGTLDTLVLKGDALSIRRHGSEWRAQQYSCRFNHANDTVDARLLD